MTVISPLVIEGIKNGSYADFEMLYRLFNAKLYHFVMKLSRNDKAIAEDVVQFTFVKLWENRTTLDPNKNIITYLCTIARNTLLNHYQHQSIAWIHSEYLSGNFSLGDVTTENMVDLHFLERHLNQLVEQLPPARKNVFLMSRKNGKSNKEIAKTLNISEKTVENQLTKALAFLRKNLIDYLPLLFLLCIE